MNVFRAKGEEIQASKIIYCFGSVPDSAHQKARRYRGGLPLFLSRGGGGVGLGSPPGLSLAGDRCREITLVFRRSLGG